MEITKIDGNVENSVATAVENYPDVLTYMCEDIKRSIRLTKYNRKELNLLFGKHNQRYMGKYNYYVWILKHGNDEFHIFTHKDRGTCISVVGMYADKKTKECIAFLGELDKKLKENE